MPSRPDLSAMLVACKVATAREIESAARARGDRPLWRALVDAKVVSAQQIFETLRDHGKFPVATDKLLGAAPPTVDTLCRIISQEAALRQGLLPFEVSADGRRAQIAMIDPTDEQALRDVARAGALQAAKVFVVDRRLMLAAAEHLYVSGRGRVAPDRNIVEPAAKVGQRSEAEEAQRLERVLLQASLALGAALEAELIRGAPGRAGTASDAARLAREVARALGHDPRRVATAGLAALFVQLDALHRARGEGHGASPLDALSSEVGWAGGGEDGLLDVVRSLAAPAAGFGRQAGGGPVQRIVRAVADFLALGGPDGESIDLDAAEQLLRASSSGAQVIDALMQVLRRELHERTPAAATVLPEAHDAEPQDLTQVHPGRAREASSQLDAEDRTQLVSLGTTKENLELKKGP